MPRILLVEDDRDVRLILEHVLIDDGHQVDAIGALAEGNRLPETGSYDLVVAGARLPDGTGMDLCDEDGARETGWLRRQSRANPSLAGNSLLTGKITGNFAKLGPIGASVARKALFTAMA
jgi:CheY-like chemotaxis protein